MRDKIVVIGSLNYDIILKSSRLPDCGETMPVDDAVFSAGGKGANQAVQAAKLGVKTYMVGCVGTDAQGDFMLETAKSYGVDTSYIRRCAEPTGMGIVNALEDGCVHASIVRGANFAVTREDVDKVEPVLKKAGLLILQMEIPLEINEYAIKKAKACGCKVLLNAAPATECPDDVMKLCDIIVVNEVEAGFYLKENVTTVEQGKKGAIALAKRYQADVVVTMGSTGSVAYTQGQTQFFPSKKVDAVESTGAGDSFIGGVGYALLQGEDLMSACQFATCCSAVTVCRLGAQPSMPDLSEVGLMLLSDKD